MLKTDIPQIYEKTRWIDLETLAEARLMNKIEGGIEANSIHAVKLNSKVDHAIKQIEDLEGNKCQCDPLIGTSVATNTSDINALKLRVNQIPPLDFDINQKVNANVTKIDTLKDRLDELENDTSSDAGILAAIEKNKIATENNKADISTLNTGVAEINTKIGTNEAGIATNSGLIAGINTTVSGLSSSVEEASTKATQALAKSVENATALSTVQGEVTDAVSKATAANNKAIEAHNKANWAKEDVDKLKETVDFHDIDVNNLYNTTRIHESQLDVLDEHVATLSSKDRQLEMNIQSHNHHDFYSRTNHTHSNYASTNHSHSYANVNHDHDEILACVDVYNGIIKTKGSSINVGTVSGGTSMFCGSGHDYFRVDSSIGAGYANESLGKYSSYQVASLFCGQQNKSINSSRNVFLGGGNECRNAHGTLVGGTLGRVSGANKILAGFGGVSLETTRSNGLDDILVLGNGQLKDKQLVSNNAFKISSDGAVFAEAALNTTGADYAEYFEWLDGNPDSEDRVGVIVTLDGDKIRPATVDDNYVLGIISATPAIIGDSFNERWKGKYATDEWGRIIYETVTTTDYHPTGIERLKQKESEIPLFEELTQVVPKLSTAFKSNDSYVPRENRIEFSPVGLIGKLLVKDDGTATINSYVKAVNGVATLSEERTNMRVMERISDNIIRVMFR